jgi:hypothetical protein
MLPASRQQPGGDTPGVAAAPVALAAIVPGVARFITMLSAHANVFGVDMTTIRGSMLASLSRSWYGQAA